MVQLDELAAKIAAFEQSQTELAGEIREARRPVGGYKALDVVRRDRAATHGKTGGFKSLGHFAQAAKYSGTNPERHKEMSKYLSGLATKALPSGMNESVGADGAYLIPPQFANELLMRTYSNDLLSRVTMMPMQSNKLSIPAVNETSRADGSRFGGIRAYWAGEGDTLNASKPDFHTVDLMPSALTAMVRVTDDLLADASALEQFLTALVSMELQFKVGDAIVNGDGVKKPLGLLNSNAKVTVAKETGQAAASIQTENILKMWARLHASCRANAVWLINQDAEPQLPLMTVGVAGAQLAVYMPPGGLSSTPFGTLLGRPVIPVEFASTLGTEGDITLFDPTQYLAGSIGTMESAVSMHLYFDTRETAFRFVMRIDGKPWWLSPLVPHKGTATQSCIVTLADRS